MKRELNFQKYVITMMGIILLLISSCKKDNDENKPETGTVTDVEGNVYKIVKIGAQWWMAENLKTTKYNDGTPIPLLNNSNNWWDEIQKSPCYGWYLDDPVKYKNTIGAYYNWYTVNTGKLAPSGWHIPGEAEVDTLIKFLGGENVAGGKMKSTGSLDKGTGPWSYPNEGATNSSGFSGGPGGFRYITEDNQYDIGYWWMIAQHENPDVVYCFQLFSTDDRVQKMGTFHKATGYSVRCIKNKSE
jgi:uncharacterized protein (TIGR02145 family)